LAASFVGGVFVVVGSRAFAFLGGFVDDWRPTPPNQARPGHENFGGGLICLLAPGIVAAVVGPDTFAAVSWNNLFQWLAAAVVLAAPLAAVLQLLRWKNARLEFDGTQICRTDFLGRREPWHQVVSTKMSPPLRDEGRVGFEVSNGWIIANTRWTNIRLMYESLADAGVNAEPWREKAQWSDLWR
jgi:hypothetical protein